jgi:hypothetical protein
MVSQQPAPADPPPGAIPALSPGPGGGHRLVLYGDCCSGVPDGPHEATFAAVNGVVARLHPQPDLVCFLGDEIRGLVPDAAGLRRQWLHWLDREMAWLDRAAIPLYHTTGNHTTYDEMSETVFRPMLAHLPRNGPPDQEGLSYWVRRGDLLLVFANTAWSGLGEGRVETAWLDETLAAHTGARFKLVLGHHPAWPVNGFSGDYQRHLDAQNRDTFWQVLVRHGILAYICSHIMAFDVQVHEGVLQIVTAGAGTQPLMPEGTEYHHCVQLAVDDDGLRYQVLDTAGRRREWLAWPLDLPPSAAWARLKRGEQDAPLPSRGSHAPRRRHPERRAASLPSADPETATASKGGPPRSDGLGILVAWCFDGRLPAASQPGGQTLLSAWTPGEGLSPLWIGLQGPDHRLTALLSAAPGRSPHRWLGPQLPAGQSFSIQIALHGGMGPGGLLWRWDDAAPWSCMRAASAWGAERLGWQACWSVGQDQYGAHGRPFQGEALAARWCASSAPFSNHGTAGDSHRSEDGLPPGVPVIKPEV